MTTVTVVTPWWNHAELRRDYWAAIEGGRPDEVITIENGAHSSRDAVIDVTRLPGPGFAESQHLVPRNLGFAKACNRGLGAAQCDAVLFLNNDIVMTRGDWLRPIRDELRPGILVGAELRAPAHAAVDGRILPYLDGWCLAGMRDDLLSLGGWDEGYEEPAYFGDNDLCLRARRAGMNLVQAEVGLRHISNVTTRDMDVAGVSARNYDRYAAKVRELLAVA